MIGTDDQAHEVRDDDADKGDRTGERDRGASRKRGADERHPLSPFDVDTACGGSLGADADEVQHARQGGHGRYGRQ